MPPCASAARRRLMKPGPAISALAMPSLRGQLLGEPAWRGRAAAHLPSSRCAARRWWRSHRARGCAAARRRRRRGAPRRPGLVAPARRRRRHGRGRRAGRGSPDESSEAPRTGFSPQATPCEAPPGSGDHPGSVRGHRTRRCCSMVSQGRTYTACMASGKNSRAVRSARSAVVTKRSTPWGMIAAAPRSGAVRGRDLRLLHRPEQR